VTTEDNGKAGSVGRRQGPDGNSAGGGVPRRWACTESSNNWKTARPCRAQVTITVQILSHHRRPFSLRVPCLMCRSITAKRIACSAKLFVGPLMKATRAVNRGPNSPAYSTPLLSALGQRLLGLNDVARRRLGGSRVCDKFSWQLGAWGGWGRAKRAPSYTCWGQPAADHQPPTRPPEELGTHEVEESLRAAANCRCKRPFSSPRRWFSSHSRRFSSRSRAFSVSRRAMRPRASANCCSSRARRCVRGWQFGQCVAGGSFMGRKDSLATPPEQDRHDA